MDLSKRWLTQAEVAEMLGFGLTKTKTLVLRGEIRSVKHGHHRKIRPQWVDEFVERVSREQQDWSAA
jgi:excisionase family DNA binding protein